MTILQALGYVVILGGVAFGISFASIGISSALQNKAPRKRYHFHKPDETKFKESVDTNRFDDNDGSAVDKERALKGFKT